MILLIGPIELLLLLAVVWVALMVSVVVAAWGASLAAIIASPAWAAALTLGLVGALVAGAEWWSRYRAARADPRWLVSLPELSRSVRADRHVVGGSALDLGVAYRLGLPVPETLVITAEAARCLLQARAGGASGQRALRALPREARSRLSSFLRRCSGGRVTVRSSFAEEGESASFAGIFTVQRGVDARSRSAIVQAIFEVLDSAQSDAAREYRKRVGSVARDERAILLQTEVVGDSQVTGCSRGPDGRSDWVTVDWKRRRSPVRSAHYAVIEDSLSAVAPGSPAERAPAWLRRVAYILMALEAELSSPVLAEFVLIGADIVLTRVQRHPDARRTTWMHRTPVDFGQRRLPRLRQDLCGGIAAMRDALNRSIRDAGLNATVGETELRDVAGVPYLDVLAYRRITSRLALDLLLRMDLQQVRRLLVPMRAPGLPQVPTESGAVEDWKRFRQWQGKHGRVAADAFVRLGVRHWLIETAERAIRLGPFERPRRVWGVIGRRLARQRASLTTETEAVRSFLTQVQERFGDLAGQLMAKGTVGFGDLFAGAKYQHASIDQIDRCLEDPGQKPAFEAAWEASRRKFAALEGQPIVDVLHHPKLPVEAGAVRDAIELGTVGLTSGQASGPAVRVEATGHRALPAGAIALVEEGRQECIAHVLGAHGVVLLGGGVLSPLARLAVELSVPAVLCTRPAARSFGVGAVLRIDGHAGSIQVGRP